MLEAARAGGNFRPCSRIQGRSNLTRPQFSLEPAAQTAGGRVGSQGESEANGSGSAPPVLSPSLNTAASPQGLSTPLPRPRSPQEDNTLIFVFHFFF